MRYFTFILLLLPCLLWSQKNNEKGVVFYSIIESPFLGKRNGPDQIACLVFNKTESSYVKSKDSLNNLIKLDAKKVFINQETGSGYINNGMTTYKKGIQVYIDYKKDSVWSSSLWEDYAYLKEKRVAINWQLLPEIKKINSLECHKAVGVLRGRRYTAWYTNEIPVPYGPWKLNGLPGLIVEAYDDDNFFYFCMIKAEYPTKDKVYIDKVQLEKGKKWLNMKEYLLWCDNNLQTTYEKAVLLGIKAIRNTNKQIFKEYIE